MNSLRWLCRRAPRLHPLALSTALALCALAFSAGAQPTVNGLFYGDGDDALYQPYATSANGSVLYSYLDASTTTLYVALVVDHSVNDMVCSPQANKVYTASAGWGGHRDCKRASDSEFATFSLECAPGSPNSWTWQQALSCSTTAGPPESDWVSDSTCGPSSTSPNWPPGVEANATSSWVANVNTYQNATTARAWNLYQFGTDVKNGWKSPFVNSSPNDVTQVPGYPTYSGSNYQWEWSMVYEWSVVLGSGGANCGSEAIFFLAGTSHHSPGKDGSEDDPFTPPPGGSVFSDWGDLPDTYGTLNASGGARHNITTTGPYLGSQLQAETDGQPTADATGDGSEEDGVTAVVDENWTAGSIQSFDVVVANAPSGALLGGWFDWNGDGDFDDVGEFFTWSVSEGTQTLDVTVGAGFDWQNDELYARFRVFSSGSTAPGGSLDQADYAGTATDGEVEDYFFEAGSLPVTLNALTSERHGGELTVRWQTASETDNVGFEIWGLVRGEWQPLSELIASRGMSSALPETYEVTVPAPPGLTALELVDYDSRGRLERFGSFRLDSGFGEFQPVREIDWRGPRENREKRLRERGFVATLPRGEKAGRDTPIRADGPRSVRGESRAELGNAATGSWKKLRQGEPLRGDADTLHVTDIAVATATGRNGKGNAGEANTDSVRIAAVPRTHVAVTDAGIQRVTYEDLRDGGLDLAGTHAKDIAVTWRGAPVERWVSGPAKFGPGSALEFLGLSPRGDDALYLDANLYQVSVDRDLAESMGSLGKGKAKKISPSYSKAAGSDEPLIYRHQSPTGDPWVERSLLVRQGRTTELTLDLTLEGPVADGPGRLVVGLGTLTDLPDLLDAAGRVIPEHNVELWFGEPGGGFTQLLTSSTHGQDDWTLEAALPDGWLSTGAHQIQLRFSTDYFFSLVVVDHYAVHYPSPYRGPSVDFAADPAAGGYRVEGFASPAVVAYAEGADGSLTRLDPRLSADATGYAAELRQIDAAHFWVTEAPHQPAVFTTEASPDLLAGPADLVVIAGSSFVGTRALDDYLAQRSAFDPVVVDVEDIYNAVGYGMALPSAITDYLRARDAVHPFSHVQLVGADCYDRRNYLSDCVSFLPLPTAPVGVSRFTPSQNRLVDLSGDGVADKAVAQFSVRDEAELETIVAKAAAWQDSGLASQEAALLIAEESDGLHSFSGQIDRLRQRLGWSSSEVLDLADHPQIQTAREALKSSLDQGRAVTVFSGHSSPTVWSFRGLLTTGTAAGLTNDGLPTLMVPLACETTYDISPSANVLGHQLLFASDAGALAISGAAALSNLEENERMANHVLDALDAGQTLGEAVLAGRRALGNSHQELQDNWITQGDVAVRLER